MAPVTILHMPQPQRHRHPERQALLQTTQHSGLNIMRASPAVTPTLLMVATRTTSPTTSTINSKPLLVNNNPPLLHLRPIQVRLHRHLRTIQMRHPHHPPLEAIRLYRHLLDCEHI